MNNDSDRSLLADGNRDWIAAALGLSVVLNAAGGFLDAPLFSTVGFFVFITVGVMLILASVFEDSDGALTTVLPADRRLGSVILGAGSLQIAGYATGLQLLRVTGSLVATVVVGGVIVTWVLSAVTVSVGG